MMAKKRTHASLALIFTLGMLLVMLINPHAAAQQRKIVLATDSWPPFYSPDLENGGYLTEIVKESFRRVGYDCEVEFVPWKRAVIGAKEGVYDGLLGAFYTEDRLKSFTYSEPAAVSQLVFFSKKGRDITYNELQDLAPFSIGVIRGYTYSKEFDSADYLHKEQVSTIEQNIHKVLAERIDIAIDSKEVLLYKLATSFPDYHDLLEIIDPPYVTNQLYVPISKKAAHYKRVVDAFNRGLRMIREDGTYDSIMKHSGY